MTFNLLRISSLWVSGLSYQADLLTLARVSVKPWILPQTKGHCLRATSSLKYSWASSNIFSNTLMPDLLLLLAKANPASSIAFRLHFKSWISGFWVHVTEFSCIALSDPAACSKPSTSVYVSANGPTSLSEDTWCPKLQQPSGCFISLLPLMDW